MAVVGMCFTGGIALATVVQPQVRAVVSAQPALPLPLSPRARASVGLSHEDLEEAKRCDKPILALRFKHDPICPRKRIETMERDLAAAAIPVPPERDYGDYEPKIPRLAHSVLTGNLADIDDHPTRKAMEAVIAFLRNHLIPS